VVEGSKPDAPLEDGLLLTVVEEELSPPLFAGNVAELLQILPLLL